MIEIEATIDWSDPVEEDVDDGGRKGLPSASEYPRMHACPGYIALKRKLPRKPAGASAGPYADSGKKIHSALAGDKKAFAELTDEEERIFDMCERQWDGLCQKYIFTKPYGPPIEEQRLFFQDRFSGQFDRIKLYLEGGEALCVDFKTGRAPVETAETNKQMRAYAVLLKNAYPKLTKIYVAVIQPWVSEVPIVAMYEAQELQQSQAELVAVLAISEKPDARRIPGKHCKYCPCRANCEEARSVPLALARVDPLGLVTNSEIAAFLDQVALAESVIDAVKKEARERLARGQEISSPSGPWTLAPGRTLAEITEPTVVFARVSALGVTQDQFMQAVKIQKGNLKVIIKKATGAKGKALDDHVAAVLEGCTEEKQSASYLKKVEPV